MKKIATIAGASVTALAMGVGLVGASAVAAAPHDRTTHKADRLTGSEAEQAIAAALAAVPGTADHAHKTADGGYRVKVETAEGKTIIVTLDSAFIVTGQQEATGKKRTPVTDEERTKASEAALAAVPGATVLEVSKTRDAGFAVVVRTSDGVKKIVKLDSSYTLVSVQDAKKGKRGKHGRHAKGAEVTGEELAKAEAAALTAVPGGTVVDVHKKGSSYHVLVKKTDGTKVHVTLAADFTVTATTSFTMKTRS